MKNFQNHQSRIIVDDSALAETLLLLYEKLQSLQPSESSCSPKKNIVWKPLSKGRQTYSINNTPKTISKIHQALSHERGHFHQHRTKKITHHQQINQSHKLLALYRHQWVLKKHCLDSGTTFQTTRKLRYFSIITSTMLVRTPFAFKESHHDTSSILSPIPLSNRIFFHFYLNKITLTREYFQ